MDRAEWGLLRGNEVLGQTRNQEGVYTIKDSLVFMELIDKLPLTGDHSNLSLHLSFTKLPPVVAILIIKISTLVQVRQMSDNGTDTTMLARACSP